MAKKQIAKKARKAPAGKPRKAKSWNPPTQASASKPARRTAGLSLSDDTPLRQHVTSLLDGGQAHLRFDDALEGLPPDLRSKRVQGLPYSAWQLLEHMRIAQWDILEFSRNPDHVSPKWPEEYWPESEAPADAKAWKKSVAAFKADLAAMRELVTDPGTDLLARIPHGDGQTILREALLVADHNAYHLGQLVVLRKVLGAWKG